ncbi:hypothetical protein [Phaeodactylibacter luteus]|uniref:Uncharacterized protein n=1 Tax=Phaeodactylibacter luteus TaxID=1564516 RepID=A0A5C6RLB0_9BACT|nr:hypothetical protein [Phaeodactylibacter luteus]TXB62112.1 hypothetical protein FRY97_15865 [Phaeodactylibacter luteus]
MNRYILILFLFFNFPLHSQSIWYDNAKVELETMLTGEQMPSFKNAVITVENAFLDGQLDIDDFGVQIAILKFLVQKKAQSIQIEYDKKDLDKVKNYASLFSVLKDTTILLVNSDTIFHTPYIYDFDDVFGSDDWQKMFVSKLLTTKKGNCHSLPYLYKILATEIGEDAHLALAPNHIYIKHRAEKCGMYNTELTSGTFPIDAWLMASGYISLESVQKGIYLDTLTEKESIALCVIDLAQGYNHKYPDNDGTFVIKCCALALQHFPDFVNALLLKAETRLKQLQAMQKKYGYTYLKEVTKLEEGMKFWDEMNSLYMKIYQLGYRQMPEQMYVEWLTSLKTEKEKYTNKQVEQMNRN